MRVKTWTKFAFVSPCIIYMLLVIMVPLIFTLYISFTAWDRIAPISKAFVGLSNYIQVFSDPDFELIFKNTIYFVVGTVALEFLIGLGLALILVSKRFVRKPFFLAIFIMPLAISPVVTGQLWRYIFEPSGGTINIFLKFVGIVNRPFWLASARLAMPSLILAHVWQWTSLMMILIFSGLQTIPEEIYEAASLDGASGPRMLYYITLPLIRNVSIIAIMFSTIISFKVFDVIYCTTFGGPGIATEVFSISIYRAGLVNFKLNSAAALSQILFVFSLVIITLYIRQIKVER